MNNRVKKYIENNIDLIDSDFEKFILQALYILSEDDYVELTAILESSGINIGDVKLILFKFHCLNKLDRTSSSKLAGGDFFTGLLNSFNTKQPGEALINYEHALETLCNDNRFLIFYNDHPALEPKFQHAVLRAGVDPREWFAALHSARKRIDLYSLPGNYKLIG